METFLETIDRSHVYLWSGKSWPHRLKKKSISKPQGISSRREKMERKKWPIIVHLQISKNRAENITMAWNDEKKPIKLSCKFSRNKMSKTLQSMRQSSKFHQEIHEKLENWINSGDENPVGHLPMRWTFAFTIRKCHSIKYWENDLVATNL